MNQCDQNGFSINCRGHVWFWWSHTSDGHMINLNVCIAFKVVLFLMYCYLINNFCHSLQILENLREKGLDTPAMAYETILHEILTQV